MNVPLHRLTSERPTKRLASTAQTPFDRRRREAQRFCNRLDWSSLYVPKKYGAPLCRCERCERGLEIEFRLDGFKVTRSGTDGKIDGGFGSVDVLAPSHEPSFATSNQKYPSDRVLDFLCRLQIVHERDRCDVFGIASAEAFADCCTMRDAPESGQIGVRRVHLLGKIAQKPEKKSYMAC